MVEFIELEYNFDFAGENSENYMLLPELGWYPPQRRVDLFDTMESGFLKFTSKLRSKHLNMRRDYVNIISYYTDPPKHR